MIVEQRFAALNPFPLHRSFADLVELDLSESGPSESDPSVLAERGPTQLCDMVRRMCASVSIAIAVNERQRSVNSDSIARKPRDPGGGLILFALLSPWDISAEQMHGPDFNRINLTLR